MAGEHAMTIDDAVELTSVVHGVGRTKSAVHAGTAQTLVSRRNQFYMNLDSIGGRCSGFHGFARSGLQC